MHLLSVLFLICLVTFSCQCPANIAQTNYLRTFGGHCYEFILHHHVHWQTAVNECGKKGGNLVVVNNIEEQYFLMTSLRSFPFQGQGVWIGLHDKETEGTFKWITDDPVTFTYWGVGQPNGNILPGKRFILDSLQATHILPDEDCVLLKYTDSGHWHDYDCEKLDLLGLVPTNFPYICEYAQTAKPVIPVSNTYVATTPIPPTTTTQSPITNTPSPSSPAPTTTESEGESSAEFVIG